MDSSNMRMDSFPDLLEPLQIGHNTLLKYCAAAKARAGRGRKSYDPIRNITLGQQTVSNLSFYETTSLQTGMKQI